MTTPDMTRRRLMATSADHRVTPAELFFDLVFVYAITQVTALMSQDISARRIAEGVLVLCLLWWCWCSFAWLGNVVRSRARRPCLRCARSAACVVRVRAG